MSATLSPDELLTPRQCAELLHLRVQTLAVWRSTGAHNLPFIKVGTSVRYRRSDVAAWLAARTIEHTGQLTD